MGKPIYIKLSTFFFVFFFAWLVFLAFMPMWFDQALHLTGTQIGIIFAANSILTMLMEPVDGYISDKIGMKKHLLYFIVGLVILTGPFFTMVYAPLLTSNFYAGVIAGGLYMATAFNAGIASIESYIEKCSRRFDFEFGRSRMWGSLGAAAGIFCAGRVFNIDMNMIFWIASGTALLLLPILMFTHVVGGSGLVTNIYAISAIKLLHAIELSILLVSVFKYIAKNFDNRLASVMYLVGFQLSNQLGASILSPVAGSMYDSIGFASTYLILGAIVASFTAFGAFVLKSDDK